MNIKQIAFKQLNETLYQTQLENGLEVYVLPKPGFNKTYATFTTKYGSIDHHFKVNGRELQVPDGIAHFLEHKMFEKEEGDVFQTFSRYGAQPNAFTSFNRTAYLFSSSDAIEANVKTLLDFVQTPYFTEQSVEKEKGIIEQEIKMYEDNANWRSYFGLLQAFYHEHPIKIDIAGTVESIYQITKDMLYDCYETFYHPSNMLFFIVGPVDPESMLAMIQQNQDSKSFQPAPDIQRIFPAEPAPVAIPQHIVQLPVKHPTCYMGFKETDVQLTGSEQLRKELTHSVLLEMLLGTSSSFYQTATEEGLIDDSFGIEYYLEQGYGFSIMGGKTKSPDQLIQKVLHSLKQAKVQGLSKEDFERTRKKKIGSFLHRLNNPEFIANQFTRYRFNEMNLFDILPTLEELSLDEIEQALHSHIQEDQFASCTVQSGTKE